MAETDWKYLQYNVETGQKRTGDGPSGGASSLSDLDDTNISSPSDGQMLGYDETEGKWKNVPAPGGNVDDVEVNGVSVVNAQKVAEIKSYKEVTQAQYEALPDTKLSDGILYAIKDGGQAVDGFPPLIYSDEEREVGVWRDGKTLYQKTIDCGIFHSTGTKTVAHNISNLEFITAYEGCGKYDSGEFLPIPFPQSSNALNYQVKVSVDNTNIIITSNAYDVSQIYITLYYTKTTDTPGSGTWTTQGTIAHHYSTEEHIVGTWIDGKPLYEKIITGLNISMSWNGSLRTEGSVSPQVSNIKEIINARAICYYNNESVTEDISVYAQSNTWSIWGINATPINTLIIQYTKTTD